MCASTPLRKIRLGLALPLPPQLVQEFESSFEDLYLVKAGSLLESYLHGSIPPRKNSFVKVVEALGQVPQQFGNVTQQLQRVDSYRNWYTPVYKVTLEDE